MANLISPYGGKLVDLVASGERLEELRRQAASLPTVQISERAACDLELMATGGFSPLDRFMDREDYRAVVDDMRLADGTLFPIPVTLPVDLDDPKALGAAVALRDSRNHLLAVMDVEDVYEWDRDRTARGVLGSVDVRHPPGRGDARLGQVQPLRPPPGARPAPAPRLPRIAADPATGPRGRWPAPAGRTWSPSRPATRCTASTKS